MEFGQTQSADKTLKMICLPSKASGSAEFGTQYGLDKVTLNLIAEGVDGSGPFVGTVCGFQFSLLVFTTLRDARDKGEQLISLPKTHFVNPICILEDVGGSKFFLVVERFEKLVPNSSNVIDMIRDIMDMVVALDLAFKVHANLKLDEFVMVDGRVKSISTPLSPSVKGRIIVDDQVKQVYAIVRDLMLRCKLIKDSTAMLWTCENIEAGSFLELLKETYTLVDMDSLRLHPFVSTDEMCFEFHCSATTTMADTDSRHNHKNCYRASHKQRLNYDWKRRLELVEGDQRTRLEEVLCYDGRTYDDNVFDLQIFVRNFFQHPNNDLSQDRPFKGVDQMYSLCKHLFPDFLTDLHHYMHLLGLNGHSSKTETMLESFVNAWSSIKSNKQICIDPLLKACKIIAFFLAKVRKDSMHIGPFSKLLESTRSTILLKIQIIEDLANDKGWKHLHEVASAHQIHLTTLLRSVVIAMRFWQNLNGGRNTSTAAFSCLKLLDLSKRDETLLKRKFSVLPNCSTVMRILGADAMSYSKSLQINELVAEHDISLDLEQLF